MLKRNRILISRLSVLAVCTSLVPSAKVCAEVNYGSQTNVTNVVTSVDSDTTTGTISSMTLNYETLNLVPGNTAQLSVTVSPISPVVWKSSNTNIATVDANGLVKLIGFGTAEITCSATDGSGQAAVCTVSSLDYTKSNETTVQIAIKDYIYTGRKWNYTSSQSGVVQEVSKTFIDNIQQDIPADGTIPPPDLSYLYGIDVWTFKGVKAGAVTLKFSDGQGNSKLYRFTVDQELKVTVKEIPFIAGDINGDGAINSLDLLVIKQRLLGDSGFIIAENIDINKDGLINALDFALLKKKILNP